MTDSSWPGRSYDVEANLSAVGVEREKPGLEFLERLIRAHVGTFPCGTMDILLGSHSGVEPVNVQRQTAAGDCWAPQEVRQYRTPGKQHPDSAES